MPACLRYSQQHVGHRSQIRKPHKKIIRCGTKCTKPRKKKHKRDASQSLRTTFWHQNASILIDAHSSVGVTNTFMQYRNELSTRTLSNHTSILIDPRMPPIHAAHKRARNAKSMSTVVVACRPSNGKFRSFHGTNYSIPLQHSAKSTVSTSMPSTHSPAHPSTHLLECGHHISPPIQNKYPQNTQNKFPTLPRKNKKQNTKHLRARNKTKTSTWDKISSPNHTRTNHGRNRWQISINVTSKYGYTANST